MVTATGREKQGCEHWGGHQAMDSDVDFRGKEPCGHSEGERELNWGEVRRVGKWKQSKRRQENAGRQGVWMDSGQESLCPHLSVSAQEGTQLLSPLDR